MDYDSSLCFIGPSLKKKKKFLKTFLIREENIKPRAFLERILAVLKLPLYVYPLANPILALPYS